MVYPARNLFYLVVKYISWGQNPIDLKSYACLNLCLERKRVMCSRILSLCLSVRGIFSLPNLSDARIANGKMPLSLIFSSFFIGSSLVVLKIEESRNYKIVME